MKTLIILTEDDIKNIADGNAVCFLSKESEDTTVLLLDSAREEFMKNYKE